MQQPSPLQEKHSEDSKMGRAGEWWWQWGGENCCGIASCMLMWLLSQVVGGASSVFVLEESIVDPGRQMFVTYTRNMTLTKLSFVEEKCEFFVHPNDPRK